MVEYAVAEQGVDGLPHCRLVTSWHDLATPRLDPSGSLSEPDLELLRQRLRDVARQEFAAVYRVANSLKRKRAELSTADVLSRLEREMGRCSS